MAEKDPDQPMDLGPFGVPDGERKGVMAIVAIPLVFCLIAIFSLSLFVSRSGMAPDENAIAGIVAVVAVFVPLIWITITTARTARALRGEAARLRASIDALRNAYVLHQQQKAVSGSSMERKLERVEAAQKETENVIATFSSTRDPARTAATAAPLSQPTWTAADQPSLALGTPVEELTPPISVADFIRALNFPEDESDREGFRALRMALKDRDTSKLIRAAEDLLTLLSHDGIYMDDLHPDRARPEIWRRFAQGERGRAVASLAGIRDRSCLALTVGRMKADTLFRDAAHHFLRQFDKTFAEFEKNASDKEISDLAETRTARAFMLLGRVAGAFD
ncbi:MAG: hypothetical protein AAF982_01285 [Pseudomonadota bacterium]